MLAITHLIVALIIIRLLGLDRGAALLTLLFGVFIDLDHLLAIPQFITEARDQGVADVNAAMNLSVQWKSAIHDPSAIILVAPCSVAVRFFAPLLAWMLHILMDYIQIQYLGPASLVEIALLASLFALFLAIEKKALERERGDGISLAQLTGFELERATEWLHGAIFFLITKPLRLILRGSGYTPQ